MNVDIVEAVTQIAKMRNIKREVLSDILENIFLSMIKRKYGATDNFDIFVNMDKGEVQKNVFGRFNKQNMSLLYNRD